MRNIVKITIKENETTIDYYKDYFKSRKEAIEAAISHLISILDQYEPKRFDRNEKYLSTRRII